MIPREQRTVEGEQCIDVRVEGAVQRDAIGRKERRASFIIGGVLVVQMYSNVERVADEGTLLLRRGGGGRVVQDGEGQEVGAIEVLAAGRDAELFARRGDFRQRDPGGTVGGVGEIEGISVAGISCRRRQRGGMMLCYTVLSTDWARRAGLGAPRRCRRGS